MTAAARRLYELDKSKDKIRSSELNSLLTQLTPTIKILSLDCFDTILWRHTATPADVFYHLLQQPTFKALGFTAAQRKHAEEKARHLMLIKQRHSEVKLRDIYLALQPSLSNEQVTALCTEEIAAEKQACYGYPPIIELIRAAKQRGLTIIIVSDTYFEETQLRSLLAHALPTDILASISHIYCSADHGYAKTTGLFAKIAKTLNIAPTAFFHLGDNINADYAAARSHHFNALHYLRADEHIHDLARLHAIAATVFNPATRATTALHQPFLGLFSQANLPADKPETLIGYAALGPIIYSFARFICDEVNTLRSTGKQAKVLFLLRDAHLPYLACSAMTDSAIGTPVRISRFAAYAASFRTQADVDAYLADTVTSRRFQAITRQLLLPEKVAAPLINSAERSNASIGEFINQIHRPDILRIIYTKSAEYRTRLVNYLKNQIGLQAGDTLMLVDLGYHGTVQQQLTPVFAELGIDVIGRYLIALRTPGWEHNRRGLLDPSWCDEKALKTLVEHIALLEQLCTSTDDSVVDYAKDGAPIYADATISAQQQQKILSIQSECLRFIQDAEHFTQSLPEKFSPHLLRENTLAELGRLIFFPTKMEMDYLQHFEFDFNLGTTDVVPMFDTTQGLSGLHKRGIFFIEKNSKNMRMNYPAELRSAGFELSLAFLTQQRFNLDIKLKDMLLRTIMLPAILKRGHETHHTTLEALATYDGYYAAWTPVGRGDIQVSVLFGTQYEWLQIESAELIPIEAFIAQNETAFAIDAWSSLQFTEMAEKSGRLFACHSKTSAMTMQANLPLDPIEYIFRFVFRPLSLNPATG